MIIHDLEEANRALLPYVPLVGQLKGQQATLERVVPLMTLLGNPQDKLRVIHVAGTSGKTSTAYYLAALLGTTNLKIGLTVSPHIDSVTERVQINGEPLPEAVFCEELGTFLKIVQRAEQQPTYFELLYAFALWVFARQKVDYAVVETGMGGLYDATNVMARTDKICVITDIGLDHTHILGKTLATIAAQKIGIVHERNHVFMYRQAPEIMRVVEQWTAQHHASVHLVNEQQGQTTQAEDLIKLADYQRRNWLLAYSVYSYLQSRDGLQLLTCQVLRKAERISIPARMDTRQIGGKILVMDGAHNAQKMAAFVDSFQQLYPGIKPALLIGLKTGKEYETLVTLLAPFANRIITTAFNTSQDLPARAMDPEVLAEAFRARGSTQVESMVNQHQAYQALLAGPEAVYVITGSFYLLSQIRTNEQLAAL